MEIRTGRGVLGLGNPSGRGGHREGVTVRGGGGVKKRCHPSRGGGGVDFFWNNPLS